MIKKIFLTLITNLSGVIHILIGTPLILSHYGIDTLGLNSALLIILTIMTIIDFGIPAIASREVAKAKKSERKNVVKKFIQIAICQWIFMFMMGSSITAIYLMMILDANGIMYNTNVVIPHLNLSIFWGIAIASTATLAVFANMLISMNRSVKTNFIRLTLTIIIILGLFVVTYNSLSVEYYYYIYSLTTFSAVFILHLFLCDGYRLKIHQFYKHLATTKADILSIIPKSKNLLRYYEHDGDFSFR